MVADFSHGQLRVLDRLREMVRLGMGWTVLPAVQAEAPPHPLVRARRAPIAVRELVLMSRTSGVLSMAGELLVEKLHYIL